MGPVKEIENLQPVLVLVAGRLHHKNLGEVVGVQKLHRAHLHTVQALPRVEVHHRNLDLMGGLQT